MANCPVCCRSLVVSCDELEAWCSGCRCWFPLSPLLPAVAQFEEDAFPDFPLVPPMSRNPFHPADDDTTTATGQVIPQPGRKSPRVLLQRPPQPEPLPPPHEQAQGFATDTLFWHADLVQRVTGLSDAQMAEVFYDLACWYDERVQCSPAG